jgi:hypothetical protein
VLVCAEPRLSFFRWLVRHFEMRFAENGTIIFVNITKRCPHESYQQEKVGDAEKAAFT